MTSLAQDAMQYVGHPYTYAGVPANNQWDCSSFVNKCAGMDLGMAIPGIAAGNYTGTTHGPVVMDWATWTGATTIPGPPQASDLCIWPGLGALGHIGIATDSSHMISALDPALGTAQTPIVGTGPAGVPLIYRRINDTTGTGSNSGGLSLPGCVPLIGFIWVVKQSVVLRRRANRK